MGSIRSGAHRAELAKFAAIQSVSEMGFGALVHTFGVPLGGHILSVNQAICLTLGTRGFDGRIAAASAANQMALTAAALKSLSPSGARLGPMIAISVQGVLYSFGKILGGTQKWGAAAGGALLSLWAFIQPAVSAYLVFGSAFFSGLAKLWHEMVSPFGLTDSSWKIIVGLIVVGKVVVTATVCARANTNPSKVNLESDSQEPLSRRVGVTLSLLGGMGVSVGFLIVNAKPDLVQIALYGLRVGGVLILGYMLNRILLSSWLRPVRKYFLRNLPLLGEAVTHLQKLRSDTDRHFGRRVLPQSKAHGAVEGLNQGVRNPQAQEVVSNSPSL